MIPVSGKPDVESLYVRHLWQKVAGKFPDSVFDFKLKARSMLS